MLSFKDKFRDCRGAGSGSPPIADGGEARIREHGLCLLMPVCPKSETSVVWYFVVVAVH